MSDEPIPADEPIPESEPIDELEITPEIAPETAAEIAPEATPEAKPTDVRPSITGGPCPVKGYRIAPCPGRREYLGLRNGAHWYECRVCGNGEPGPSPREASAA